MVAPMSVKSGVHLLVSLAHLFSGPRLQDRIAEVGDPIGWLDVGAARGGVVDIGKALVEGDRSGPARRRLELIVEHKPGGGVGAIRNHRSIQAHGRNPSVGRLEGGD